MEPRPELEYRFWQWCCTPPPPSDPPHPPWTPLPPTTPPSSSGKSGNVLTNFFFNFSRYCRFIFRYEDRLSGKKKLQSHNFAQKAAASLLASQPQSQSRAVIHEATRQAGSGDRILPFVLKHTCADIVKPRFVAQHPHSFNFLAEAYRLAFVNGGLQTKVSSGHMDCMSFIMSSSFAQVFYQSRGFGCLLSQCQWCPPPPRPGPPPPHTPF